MPFDRDARCTASTQLTRGVPRRINLLCDRALLGAYASGRQRVDRAIVDKAAGEVFDFSRHGAQRWQRRRNALTGGAIAVGALVVGGVAVALVSGPRRIGRAPAARRRCRQRSAAQSPPPAVPAAAAAALAAPVSAAARRERAGSRRHPRRPQRQGERCGTDPSAAGAVRPHRLRGPARIGRGTGDEVGASRPCRTSSKPCAAPSPSVNASAAACRVCMHNPCRVPSPDDAGERRGAPWGWVVAGLSVGVLLMILWRWWSVEPLVDEAALARAPPWAATCRKAAPSAPAAAPASPAPAPVQPAAPPTGAPPAGAAPDRTAAEHADEGHAPAAANEATTRATKPAPPPRSTAKPPHRDAATTRRSRPADGTTRAIGKQPAPSAPTAPSPPAAANARNAAPRTGTGARHPSACAAWPSCQTICARSVPQLAFGGSVYSDTPAQRMVIFNGQVLREGDAVTNELQIEQIRPRSAVMRVRGQRFEMPF